MSVPSGAGNLLPFGSAVELNLRMTIEQRIAWFEEATRTAHRLEGKFASNADQATSEVVVCGIGRPEPTLQPLSQTAKDLR